jgi:N-acetylmuramoyl-L-alanine amidase
MNVLWKAISLCFLLLLSSIVHAKQINVESLRYREVSNHRSRLVIDLSSAVSHKVMLLANPARAVIDIKNTKLAKSLAQPSSKHVLFKKVRSAARDKKNLRIVIDLKDGAAIKSFTLKPNKSKGHRLVIDLSPKHKSKTVAKKKKKVGRHIAKLEKKKPVKTHKRPITTARKQIVRPKGAPTKSIKRNKARDIIVAIDAGHGGHDSGALGRHGTQEKDVVFQIAKKLAALVDRQAGMKAVMIRDGDYIVKLRKRMEIARSHNADLFVSIHADAFTNSKVRGASVFTLSPRGASRESARWSWLAKKENSVDSVDLVGGVQLANREDEVIDVLLDLSRKATADASTNVAHKVLDQLRGVGRVHGKGVNKANFMVLKAPDIPAILVETAFISNPSEERRLKSKSHQLKVARAIFKGVYGYFSHNAPPGSYLAMKYGARYLASASKAKATNRHGVKSNSKKYTISGGDTLSAIAGQHGVSLKSIKLANSLSNSKIRVGQILTIPRG